MVKLSATAAAALLLLVLGACSRAALTSNVEPPPGPLTTPIGAKLGVAVTPVISAARDRTITTSMEPRP